MCEIFNRTSMLIGEEAVETLNNSSVAIFGVGGVGGHVAEALARSGVGNIALIDKDVVDITNINRQIIALHSTIGKPKTQVMGSRILDINPDCKVEEFQQFYLPENCDFIDLSNYDYIVDAIDNVTAKLLLAEKCYKSGIKLISCMGTGNKLNPNSFEICDINDTSVCPLCKVMRKKLKDKGIENLTVLFSREEVIKTGSRTPASIAFVPSSAGLLIASKVITDLIKC